MWFIGVEVEQETSAPPPKKNPESTPERSIDCTSALMFVLSILRLSRNPIELQTVW